MGVHPKTGDADAMHWALFGVEVVRAHRECAAWDPSNLVTRLADCGPAHCCCRHALALEVDLGQRREDLLGPARSIAAALGFCFAGMVCLPATGLAKTPWVRATSRRGRPVGVPVASLLEPPSRGSSPAAMNHPGGGGLATDSRGRTPCVR